MELYGYLASPPVMRVVLAARAKGLELPLVPPPGGGIKSPEYLAINPLGKMPAFEDGGRYLAESVVICEYLDETHPARPLLPADPFERAQVRTLARVTDLYVITHLGPLFRNANPAQRNQAEVDATFAALHKSLGDLEAFMGPGPWAHGDTLTLADCVMVPSFFLVFAMLPAFGVADLFAKLPKLSRWWATVLADPVTSRLHGEYQEAFAAFMKSRAAA